MPPFCVHIETAGSQVFHLSDKVHDVLCQKLWFLKGSKMPSTWHVRVSDDVLVGFLCPDLWCMCYLLRKGCNPCGNIYSNPRRHWLTAFLEQVVGEVYKSLLTGNCHSQLDKFTTTNCFVVLRCAFIWISLTLKVWYPKKSEVEPAVHPVQS